MVRQADVVVNDLDAIYLKQKGKFSSFVDETIRSGITNYMKTLSYDTFKVTDFSEASQDFDREIQRRISGVYGVKITSITIPDWELGKEQEVLAQAQIEAEAAKKKGEGIITIARANGKAKALEGRGDGVAVDLRMLAYENAGVDPNVAATSDALINSSREIAQSQTITTVFLGQQGGGVQPSFAVNVPSQPGNQPMPQPSGGQTTRSKRRAQQGSHPPARVWTAQPSQSTKGAANP